MPQNNAEVLAALPTSEQVQELILLYQLSIRLLGCNEPEEVVRVALGLLKERTKAAVVGFLWVDDEGQLRPKLVIPQEAANQVSLSRSLTELVLRQGHAVWVANQMPQEPLAQSAASRNAMPAKEGQVRGRKEHVAAHAGEHFADAVCAPLVHKRNDSERTTLGAIHVYLEAGRFRQSDFDFIIAVANLVVIALVRARAHSSLERNYERLVSDSPGYDELVGQSKPMLELKSKIERVGRAPGGVLISGESGTGKELVARAIHRTSPRADRPMVSVNCAAIPSSLIESQLFGHVQGAFTGADRDHAGYFQQADLGTLFLDEVGELPLEGQAKLLRILEGHPFLPVGATQEVQVDVRLIAATNRDLQTQVQKKKFREDLYYRLSVFELLLPPLRDRGEDLDLLIDFFLAHYRVEHGRPTLQLGDSARNKLRAYSWPGNVRQLRNLLDSAVVLATGDEIGPHDLALRDRGGGPLESL
ncbi:MAG: sigma 54-interacting transcriptional regulator, partial [Pirellulales bacterium]